MEQAKHDDATKLEIQWLLSMSGIDEVAKVGSYGAKKYGQSNWRGGSEWMRYLGSCVRHITCYIRGESVDPESGISHLAHCAYNCLILLTWAKENRGKDDRPIVAPINRDLSTLSFFISCPSCYFVFDSRGGHTCS